MTKVRIDRTPRSKECNLPASPELEVGVALPLADDDPLIVGVLVVVEAPDFFSLLNTPPWTWAGTPLLVVFEAACLNAARVSGPLDLRRVSMYVLLLTFFWESDTHGGLMTPTMPILQCET